MQFTIEKDLTIKGTRGETGNIHITFDRDLTGTRGVFLVKRTFDASDNDAFLVKRFRFGTNPAISGREIIISLTREDTENIPLYLPNSPFVFESDIHSVEYSDYVWAMKFGSTCYTDTVIPRPGTTYPTFRLYNEAYFEREGCPIIPHPPCPPPDIYATKKELIHYAAAEKQLTDQLSGGIDSLSGSVRLGFLNVAERHLADIDGLDVRIRKLEEESHDIPGIIIAISGLQSSVDVHSAEIGLLGRKVAGMETSVMSAVERSIAAAAAALEAKEAAITLASSIETQISTFTDTFVTSGGTVEYGVDAEKVFVKDYWKASSNLPALGASNLMFGPEDVKIDVVTVDGAIQHLDATDKVLSARIDAISSGSGPGLDILSGNVVKEFGAVRGEISVLSSNAKDYTDTKHAQSTSAISNLGVEVRNEIASLSGNAKTADEVLAARIDALTASIGPGISELSGSVVREFGAVRGEVASLSGNASAADVRLTAAIAGLRTDVSSKFTEVSGAVANLSGSASATDVALAGSISTLSSGTTASIAALSSNVGNAIAALSGDALNADSALGSEISTLSSSAKTADTALHGEVAALSSNVKSYVDSVSGDTYSKAVADAVSSINAFIEDTYTPLVKGWDGQVLASALNAAASGDSATMAAIGAETTRATGVENGKIDKTSIVAAFDGTLDNTKVPGAKATYDYVNSSINNLAAYYITKNAAGDAFGTKAELDAAIVSGQFYNGGQPRVPTKNDYLVVLADESKVREGLTPTTRYVFDGTNWAFQYVVNATTFTQAQVDSLNSGMTSAIHGTITSNVSTLSGGLNGLSADCVLTKAWNATRFSTIETSISTLSSATEGNVDRLDGAIDTLGGIVTSNYATLNTAIANLSGNALASDTSLSNAIASLSGQANDADTVLHGEISTLSGSAKTTDDALSMEMSALLESVNVVVDALAECVADLSGNAREADTVLHGEVTSLSGSAKTADVALGTNIGTLSGYATDHGSRIESLEFATQAQANTWVKATIPGIVLDGEGTLQDTSRYTDEEVLKLVLKIVKKMVK